MIVIYPKDETTTFLSDIISELIEKAIAKIDFPPSESYSREEITTFLLASDSGRSILYLGHGTSSEIYYYIRKDGALGPDDAKRIFKNRKLIFLSCRSAEYLIAIKDNAKVGIGFGNILSHKREVTDPKDKKYEYDSYRCIDIFRDKLITLFKICITESYLSNYTYLQFYNALKLRINKIICSCSLSKDTTERLVGELMFDLRREMILVGNSNATIM